MMDQMDIETAKDLDRRLRIVRIDQEQVLTVFNACVAGRQTLRVPRFAPLPPHEVVAVHANHEAAAFDFVVRSPSFAVVERGMQIPVLHQVEIATYDDIYFRAPEPLRIPDDK
jgi:hypothetical protein